MYLFKYLNLVNIFNLHYHLLFTILSKKSVFKKILPMLYQHSEGLSRRYPSWFWSNLTTTKKNHTSIVIDKIVNSSWYFNFCYSYWFVVKVLKSIFTFMTKYSVTDQVPETRVKYIYCKLNKFFLHFAPHFLAYLIIFLSRARRRLCQTVKNHPILPQKIGKSIVLAIYTHFSDDFQYSRFVTIHDIQF